MAELKPCPFCGGKAEIKLSSSAIAYMGSVYSCHIGCKECGLGLSENFVDMGLAGEIEEVLVEAWNRRVNDDE